MLKEFFVGICADCGVRFEFRLILIMAERL